MEHIQINDPVEVPEGIEGKQKRFSIVWLLPLIALFIGGFLLYNNFIERDITITIHFESGAGLGEGVGLEEVSGFADGVGVGPAFIELLPVLESVVELFVTAELLSTVAEGSELVEEFSAGAGVISSAKTSLGSMVL